MDEFSLNIREDLGLELLIIIGTVDFGNTLRETKCMFNCEMGVSLWKPGTNMIYILSILQKPMY